MRWREWNMLGCWFPPDPLAFPHAHRFAFYKKIPHSQDFFELIINLNIFLLLRVGFQFIMPVNPQGCGFGAVASPYSRQRGRRVVSARRTMRATAFLSGTVHGRGAVCYMGQLENYGIILEYDLLTPRPPILPVDREMIGKFLIFCAAAMMAIGDANSILLCEVNLATSPATCSNYTTITSVNFNRVYDCSGGGSSVTEFEVYGGCGPNAGSGSYYYPVVQTPSGVQLATNQAGRYCYCQIKSINGSSVASSTRWLFLNDHSFAADCGNDCAYYCAKYARTYSAFRAAFFQALQ